MKIRNVAAVPLPGDETGLRPLLAALQAKSIRRTAISLERELSGRQLALLLICYTDNAPPTVRALATQLRIDKSAVSRALDRLEALDFIERQADPRDGRSVVLARTTKGQAFLQRLREAVQAAKCQRVTAVRAG